MRTHNSRTTAIITGLAGTALMTTFIVGLVKSIALGFAGFKGALPVIIISAFVILLAVIDFYQQCVKRDPQD